jgi:hypothetical protein
MSSATPIPIKVVTEDSNPIPIILCGKTIQIANGVIENLKPEFEGTTKLTST